MVATFVDVSKRPAEYVLDGGVSLMGGSRPCSGDLSWGVKWHRFVGESDWSVGGVRG